MEYIGVNHIHPEWNMMDQFFLEVVSPALQLDSLTTSHPIQVTVKGFYKNCIFVKSLFAAKN
jgi:aminopeptidase N